MKVKYFFVWFLALAFLNLVITPTFARQVPEDDTMSWEDVEEEDDEREDNFLIGVGIFVGVVLIVGLIWWAVPGKNQESSKIHNKKKAYSQYNESEEQKEANKTSTTAHEKRFTQSGNLVVFEW